MLRPPAGSSLAWSRKDALRRFSRLLTAGAGAAAPAAHRAGDSSFMPPPTAGALTVGALHYRSAASCRRGPLSLLESDDRARGRARASRHPLLRRIRSQFLSSG